MNSCFSICTVCKKGSKGKHYMPLRRLRSGIILRTIKVNGVSTDSNTEVENWFRIVKCLKGNAVGTAAILDFFIHVMKASRCLDPFIKLLRDKGTIDKF